MAPEIALTAIPERDAEPLTVLDPMCGSGTVLSVAMQRGHNAIGVDIDPLAVMMSQLTVSPVSSVQLAEVSRAVVAGTRGSAGEPPWGDDEETERFVDYWFGDTQKRDLIALTSSITALSAGVDRLALQLAVSRIIVTKSPQASLAADTAHSRPHKVRLTSDYDVIGGFERSVAQLSRLLEKRVHSGSARVTLGDARTLESVADESVDLAVTSPPYLNAIDYIRGHKLALVWFGHSVADLRERRSASIGAERGLGTQSTDVVRAILELIEEDATEKSRLRRGMIERFAQDCVGFATELGRTLRAGGRAVLVVGNSTLRGNYIRNDAIAQQAMEHAGFALTGRYERGIPPTSRYMAIGAAAGESSITRRMRSEVVLTMDR